LREELDDATAHTLSPAYTPGLHSIAERVKRTMADAARTMLIDASLPSTFWPHGVRHAVAVRNRIPHRGTRDAPSHLLTGVRPSVKYVRVLGSTAYVVLQPAGTKLQLRTEQGVLLECLDHGVYHVLLVGGDGASPRIVESRYFTFDATRFLGVKGIDADGVNDADESEYSPDSESLGDDGSDDDAVSELSPSVDDNTEGEETSTLEEDASIPDTDEDGDGDDDGVAQESGDEFDSEVGGNGDEEGGAPRVDADSAFPEPARRYPHRTRKPPARMMTPETAQYDVPRVADPMRNLVVTTSDDPSVKEATGASLEGRDLWIAAISNEYDSKDSQGTRMPVDVAEGAPSPTHIVLRVKRYPDGVAGRFKARIFASRNHQVYDYDYTVTHAPVVDFTLLRVVLYIALPLQTYMAQVDDKTAFLNRNLKESVCVMSPRGVDNHPS
jgi:Reverse transcriptase (RNA-dependent DNA polymerase)